jgi:hypothetical protein
MESKTKQRPWRTKKVFKQERKNKHCRADYHAELRIYLAQKCRNTGAHEGKPNGCLNHRHCVPLYFFLPFVSLSSSLLRLLRRRI